MAVRKAEGALVDPTTGAVVGRGRVYLHQPAGHGVAGGTMAGLVWSAEPARVGAPYRLTLDDGGELDVVCTRCGPTDCGADVLRFKTGS